jgi:hypothetical protein
MRRNDDRSSATVYQDTRMRPNSLMKLTLALLQRHPGCQILIYTVYPK